MENIDKYYERTKNLKPSKNIVEFTKIEPKKGKAIELGCGAGKDTCFLLSKGWTVTAIDRQDVSEFIKEKSTKEDLKRFQFKQQAFEELELEESDLILANFSLPFCKPNQFNEMWIKIQNSISKEGYFVGNFFGIEDEWKETNKDMVFMTEEEVLKLFDKFDIIRFKEIKENGITGLGKSKFWHIFYIIAKKK